MNIEVWICPDCESYYGASGSHGRDLTKEKNYEVDMVRTTKHNPAKPRVIGNRAECQKCPGKPERYKVFIHIEEPVEGETYFAIPVAETETA